tara:strand:- start:4309 stop:4803 length:495 start_codon:yes stop_codon:yes gene_type:complete
MKPAKEVKLFNEVICALKYVDFDWKDRQDYGACPVLAAYLHSIIGGEIIVGDYDMDPSRTVISDEYDEDDMWGRHVWVKKGKFIYDINNVDNSFKLMFYIRDANDPRYREDQAMASTDELRDNLAKYDMIPKNEFDAYLARVERAAELRLLSEPPSRPQGFRNI